MATLFERIRSLFVRKSVDPKPKSPLDALDQYNQKLYESTDKLAQQYGELREVRAKLENHEQSLQRILQRYDEQARKHYKNNQQDLAEAALREKLKHQTELKHLESSLKELDKRIESLKNHKERLQGQLQLYKIRREAMELRYSASKTELETRELQLSMTSEDLPDIQSAIDDAERQIGQIQAQLDATRELQDESEKIAKIGSNEFGANDEEVAKEIEHMRKELLSKKSKPEGQSD